MANPLIALADERVSIVEALKRIGMELPYDVLYGNIKLYCPFGELFHADQGAAKAMRVYGDTNTAYCFAGCGYLSPVRLVVLGLDLSPDEAAELLLEESGYVAPTPDAVWDSLDDVAPPIDQDALAEALKAYCDRIDPGWEYDQFDAQVSVVLGKCLGLIPSIKDTHDITNWLNTTKTVMKKVLGELNANP